MSYIVTTIIYNVGVYLRSRRGHTLVANDSVPVTECDTNHLVIGSADGLWSPVGQSLEFKVHFRKHASATLCHVLPITAICLL